MKEFGLLKMTVGTIAAYEMLSMFGDSLQAAHSIAYHSPEQLVYFEQFSGSYNAALGEITGPQGRLTRATAFHLKESLFAYSQAIHLTELSSGGANTLDLALSSYITLHFN
jgi:hypothetical protein